MKWLSFIYIFLICTHLYFLEWYSPTLFPNVSNVCAAIRVLLTLFPFWITIKECENWFPSKLNCITSPISRAFIVAFVPLGPTPLFVVKKSYKNSTPVQDGDLLFPFI